MKLDCKGKILDLTQPVVMGILNTTPDSFSDGGCFLAPEAAVKHALEMQREGAAIIDIGGESTRPGAEEVSEAEELDRVIPVIEALQDSLEIPLSIDTSKPGVMQEAVDAGASMINDINALRADGALDIAVSCKVPVCLMHMQGKPKTMQSAPEYVDVVEDVKAFLSGRINACIAAGMDVDNILLDPGFGFGKTLEHNLQLLNDLSSLSSLGKPLLVGLSRKSMVGALTGRTEDRRLFGSIAAAVMAVERGAHIVRVHDVAASVDAVRFTMAALEGAGR